MNVQKKFQPNWSSRLAGYREHIYECLVLLYRYEALCFEHPVYIFLLTLRLLDY